MSTFTLRKTLAEIEAKEKAEQAKTGLACEICGKVYKTQKGLDSHIATKHKECDSIDTR